MFFIMYAQNWSHNHISQCFFCSPEECFSYDAVEMPMIFKKNTAQNEEILVKETVGATMKRRFYNGAEFHINLLNNFPTYEIEVLAELEKEPKIKCIVDREVFIAHPLEGDKCHYFRVRGYVEKKKIKMYTNWSKEINFYPMKGI